MMIYAFDVDDTLEISGGPVRLAELVVLRRAGHVLGLCGNWAVVTATVPRWHRLFSFIGPMETSKASFLAQVKRHCAADDYVMIGNDPLVFGQSPDREAAEQAGWRFLREAEFAAGAR
ncbi:MAG: hypothetical protein E6J70_00890 [Deltaproteobacteria bacterium]|nr:MAG: hypothetical protein E6J70_00890 [Deltaproteobacteria bacterium]